MSEIYKLKKGSSYLLVLRYAGDLSDPEDYFAHVMADQSTYVAAVETTHQTQWTTDSGSPFPTPPYDFANAYNNNISDFADFIDTHIILSSFGRYPQNGDVITFENWDHVFVFSYENIVWTVKKGNQEVYRVEKDGEVVFQRQYLRGYQTGYLSSRVSSTPNSITWRLTNRDPDVSADTYANVVEGDIPSLDFSSGYKRGTLRSPLSYYDWTTSGLNDGSRYYCRAGLKHPTFMIMPIIDSYYSSYNLPVAAPFDEVIDVTENSVTIRFTNNSSTKTIELFARVATSAGTRTTRGTIEPGWYRDVKFSGLSSGTTYNLYYHASYVIQNSSPQITGTWVASDNLFASAVDYPISIGGNCTTSSGPVYYSSVTEIKAECIGYKPGVSAVVGYLPGPTASQYYTKSSHFTTTAPPTPTKWTYIGSTTPTGSTIIGLDRGNILSCNTNESAAYTWLNNNHPPSNYAVGAIVQVSSHSGFFPNAELCTNRYFRADL